MAAKSFVNVTLSELSINSAGVVSNMVSSSAELEQRARR